MIEREHRIEEVARPELEEHVAESRARQERAGVGDAARLRQARRARSVDVDVVPHTMHRRKRRRGYRARVEFRMGDHALAIAEGLEQPSRERIVDDHPNGVRAAYRVRERAPEQVMIDERGRRSDAGDAEKRRDVTWGVSREQTDDVARPHTAPMQLVRDPRRRQIEPLPGQPLVAHHEGQLVGDIPCVAERRIEDGAAAPRANQPGQQAHHPLGGAQLAPERLAHVGAGHPTREVRRGAGRGVDEPP